MSKLIWDKVGERLYETGVMVFSTRFRRVDSITKALLGTV